MATASYRVARMSGNRMEVLGEFSNEAEAIDMADRAKYMMPFVLRTADNGTIEVLKVSGAIQRVQNSILSESEASS